MLQPILAMVLSKLTKSSEF